MTDQQILIGSLSNDLLRVAVLTQRKSHRAAKRFFLESQRWSQDLEKYDQKKYIQQILHDLRKINVNELNIETAEKLLMYSVLLQNYALHYKE